VPRRVGAVYAGRFRISLRACESANAIFLLGANRGFRMFYQLFRLRKGALMRDVFNSGRIAFGVGLSLARLPGTPKTLQRSSSFA